MGELKCIKYYWYEEEIRLGLKNYFPWNQLGFEVTHDCENGEEALLFIKKNNIDIILTDIRMPIMTGVELAREVSNQNKSIKIIFLSGYRDFEYAKEALKYGVIDYIVKPGKFEEIQALFSKLKIDLDKKTESNNSTTTKYYSDNIIQAITTYIKEHYATVTLDDIAELVQMSPTYLSSYFKEKTGENFSNYVTEIRMKQAAKLLCDFRYKTYDVSSLVGYTNPKNFTRMFKKYHGMSPREYRSQKGMTENT